MSDRLWRLLGACESLARAETAALTGRNLVSLHRTQKVKSVLLADLEAEASLVHASCDSRARLRLNNLLESNRQNARTLSFIKAGAASRLRQVRAAASQLQALRSAYIPSGSLEQQALSVHG